MCRLHVHSTEDEVIPVEDAARYVGLVPSFTLRLVSGANHSFTEAPHAHRLVHTIVTPWVGDTCAAHLASEQGPPLLVTAEVS